MRKLASLAMCVVAAAVCCLGCGKGNLQKYEKQISELREYMFAAEDTAYRVTAISGTREDPYEIDGKSADKRAFTVVTVTPAVYSPDKAYRYRAQIGEETYEGDLLPHPFAQTYSADLPTTATADFSFCVLCGGEQSYTLARVQTGETISAERAFTIALEKLKKELKRFRAKGKLRAEIYIRLLENPTVGEGGYFWYVAFIDEQKSTIAILLRASDGSVAATRI